MALHRQGRPKCLCSKPMDIAFSLLILQRNDITLLSSTYYYYLYSHQHCFTENWFQYLFFPKYTFPRGKNGENTRRGSVIITEHNGIGIRVRMVVILPIYLSILLLENPIRLGTIYKHGNNCVFLHFTKCMQHVQNGRFEIYSHPSIKHPYCLFHFWDRLQRLTCFQVGQVKYSI